MGGWKVVSSRSPWDRGGGGDTLDYALFGTGASLAAQDRWRVLARSLGFFRVAHFRQTHGSAVLVQEAGAPGLHLGWEGDGHATGSTGVLLAITVADCVPVYLVDPATRAVALLHAGWRGVAGGILEAGIEKLVRELGSRPEKLHLHLGPAICGSCY